MKVFLLTFFAVICLHLQMNACTASDADDIYISSMTVQGTDNVVLCNSSTTDITLSGGIMVVDSDPSNVETLADITIPALGCVTLIEDIDFSFGFSAGNGDGFTLSCADGTVIATKSFGPTNDVVIFCADPPQVCNPADAASVYISKVFHSTGDDRVLVCNSSSLPVVLAGTTLADGGNSSMLGNAVIIAPMSCVTLTRGIDFAFGLGDDDSFTIDCGGTIFDSVTYDQSASGEDCFVAADAPAGPCDPTASVYISTVFADEGTDRVVVCNETGQTVSLDGAQVSDASNTETIFGLSIPPFSCITLTRNVDFTFGLGTTDEFSISCGGTVYDMESWDDGQLVDGEFFVAAAPVAPATGIPTMGEWGLMCLTFLLMIVGVVRLKETEQQLAYQKI